MWEGRGNKRGEGKEWRKRGRERKREAKGERKEGRIGRERGRKREGKSTLPILLCKTYKMGIKGAILSKLIHEKIVVTVWIIDRVVMTTPIMAHLVPNDENLLISNERDLPTHEVTNTSIVDNPFLSR